MVNEKFRKLIKDSKYYMEKCLKIRTKTGKLIKFKLNSSQERFNNKINELQDKGTPVRIIILKARQMGFSTLTEGRIFHKTATTKLTNSFIIAHKESASTNLFNMFKLFFEELPALLRPMKKASNAKELIFENPTSNLAQKQKNPGLRSKVKIDTAKNLGAGRSDTIHNLHASEVAFWENAATVMTGLLQAVPNTSNTMIVVESTANGVGGYFYDLWQQAKRGENDFIPLFFAWFEHDEYHMPVPPDFELTEEERELKQTYNLMDEQLVWRRWAIRNNCGGDPEVFKQEYPSNDQEAFLTSGRSVFDNTKLELWKQSCDSGKVGNLVSGKFDKNEKGYLTIWEDPDPDEDYVVFGDVAEGLAHGDFSCLDVLKRSTLEQVAQWHGHIDPDLLGYEAVELAKFYNQGIIGIEVNNHGLTTVKAIERLKYYRVYQRQQIDNVTKKTTLQYGWKTTQATKPVMIDDLVTVVREDDILIRSKETLNEMQTFVKDDKGLMAAQEGCYDDRVISIAGALQVHKLTPVRKKAPVVPPEPNTMEHKIEQHRQSLTKKKKVKFV